jgi:hypothetical protein
MAQLTYQKRQIVSKLKMGAALSRDENKGVFYLNDGKSQKAIDAGLVHEMEAARILCIDLIGFCFLKPIVKKSGRTKRTTN